MKIRNLLIILVLGIFIFEIVSAQTYYCVDSLIILSGESVSAWGPELQMANCYDCAGTIDPTLLYPIQSKTDLKKEIIKFTLSYAIYVFALIWFGFAIYGIVYRINNKYHEM
jgi:hypothetical protein